MKNAYNYSGAEQLIPLIRTIHREIRERSEAIRDLNVRLHQLRSTPSHTSARTRELRVLNLRADIANHRREIRVANKELERLGCLVDEENPFRVLIPGSNGEIRSGFSWRVGDNRVRAFISEDPNEAA